MRTITFVQEFMFCPISDIHANLAAVGWVLRGYSEQYSGFQTVIVSYGLPILKETTAWKPGYPGYGRKISVDALPACCLQPALCRICLLPKVCAQHVFGIFFA